MSYLAEALELQKDHDKHTPPAWLLHPSSSPLSGVESTAAGPPGRTEADLCCSLVLLAKPPFSDVPLENSPSLELTPDLFLEKDVWIQAWSAELAQRGANASEHPCKDHPEAGTGAGGGGSPCFLARSKLVAASRSYHSERTCLQMNPRPENRSR